MSEAGVKTPSWMRYAPVVMFAVAGLVGVGFLFALYVPITASYAAEAKCESMPADDVELLKWVARQPGVVASTVNIQRPQGGRVVRIHFRMTRPLIGEPEPPNWHQAFTDLGYSVAPGYSP